MLNNYLFYNLNQYKLEIEYTNELLKEEIA